MTTLKTRPAYTSVELASLYPSTLELQQVQIILRHGERTPTNSRFQNTGLPEYWPYCNAAKRLAAAAMNTADATKWETLLYTRQLETFGNTNDLPVKSLGPNGEHDAICQASELTDKGRETTLALGSRLRKLYIDQLGFMPDMLTRGEGIFLRSTAFSRSQESVLQAFVGMYPPERRQLDPEDLPVLVTRSLAYETFFPNTGGCRRLRELSDAFATRAAKRWNDSPEMSLLNKKLGKYMPPETPTVKVDGRPRLSGIMDTVNSTLAHGPGTRLPSEFSEPKVLEAIDKIACEEWYDGFKYNDEYRRLGVGSFAGDIVARMVGATEREGLGKEGVQQAVREGRMKSAAAKMLLAGAHDTTLAAFLTAFGAFDGQSWPPYTSHLAFELFRAKEPLPPPPGQALDTPEMRMAQVASPAAPPQPAENEDGKSSSGGWFSSLFGGGSSKKPKYEDLATSPSNNPRTRAPLSSLTYSQRAPLNLADHFVRVRYNDEPVALPTCAAPGKHMPGDPTFCTLEAFKEAADKITPLDWRGECKSNLGKPIEGIDQ